MKSMKLYTVIILVFFVITNNSYSQNNLETTINAYAPIGHHFQGNNKYSSVVTYNGYIYVFSMDTLRRPYINKIDETNSGSIETVLIDKDETDIYRVFDDVHNRFSIGIDEQGYIHVIGDMHHGNLGSTRNVSTDNPLPERFNGSIGDHGMAIMAAREFGSFKTDIKSDCACLNNIVKKVIETSSNIKFMRDATRGGISTVLSELVENKGFGLEIDEASIPVKESVKGMCELLGFDPFYVANEGKIIFVVAEEDAEKVLEAMKQDEAGEESAIIGTITEEHKGKGWITTGIGGKRIIDMLSGEQLPRIC